jgi:hypothetical protein
VYAPAVRVWTNGEKSRVLVGDTLLCAIGSALKVEGKVERSPKSADASPDEVVAFTTRGDRLEAALRDRGLDPVDAVALDERRVAAVLNRGRKAPLLVVGIPTSRWELELELRAKVRNVEWPEGLIWAEGVSPPFEKAPTFTGAPPRGVRVRASDHGLAVAASGSGHVAVIRPGDTTLTFVWRVPSQDEARIDAVATREGVLVTLTIEGRHSAAVHLAEDGVVLGAWPAPGRVAWGTIAALPVKGDRVLAYDQERNELELLELPALRELSRVEVTPALVDGAVSPDGAVFAVADASTLLTGQIEDDDTISLDEPVDLTKPAPEAPVVKKSALHTYTPRRAFGPTQVAFPSIKRIVPPWSAAKGASLLLPLWVRSAGGAGLGLRVELTGPAVAAGLVRPELLRCGPREEAFVRVPADGGELWRAVLEDVEIPEGFIVPLEPPPKTEEDRAEAEVLLGGAHFEIEAHLVAAKTGKGLLSIVISTLSSAAPMKWTRPLVVH